MQYIQNANTMIIIAVSMTVAMVEPPGLTLAPWCSVFHHWTEK